MEQKSCTRCNETKSLNEFYSNGARLATYCKTCSKELARDNYKNNKERKSVYAREWRTGAGQKKVLLNHAKLRAQEKGIEFSLCEDDIEIPDVCPVLGIPLRTGVGKQEPGSPSIDRISLDGGYTPDNIQVMSSKANKMKNDASPDELRAFADWVYTTVSGGI